MATTAATLIQRTRRFLQDWPEGDVLTVSVSTGATIITVADSSIYGVGQLLQVGTEGMVVRGMPSGTQVTVYRGARGSTAATHAAADPVLIRPRFLDVTYLDALNAGISATFPWIYRPVTGEFTGVLDTVYEYDIPLMDTGDPIPYLSRLQFLESGDLTYREFQGWNVIQAPTPFIKLRRPLPSNGTLRVVGFGPIPTLTSLTDSLHTLFPAHAQDALTMFAAQYLLAASESARVREDTGARDQRDNANRPGSAIAIGNQVLNRFQRRIMDAGMPPMPKHVVSIV